MRRLKALFLAFALLVIVPAGVLLKFALDFIASEERRLLADAEGERERAMRAVEAEARAALARIDAVETQRPWYHYRPVFVQPDVLANTIAFNRSPLNARPADPFVRAYFEWLPAAEGLSSPADELPAQGIDDDEEAARARRASERVREIAPAVVPALRRMLEARADLFPLSCGEVVTSKLVIENYTNPAPALEEIEAAKKGDAARGRNLEQTWERHEAAQTKARAVVQEAKRASNVAPGASAPGPAREEDGLAARPAAPEAERARSDRQLAQRQTALDEGFYRAVQRADPLAAAVRTYPFRYAWVGEGSARTLIGARLADLDGTPALQGFELDPERFRALARASLERLGLAEEVEVRDAADARDVLALAARGPARGASAVAALAPSRRLLYGSAGLIFFLATVGLAVLYGIARGHLEFARQRTDFLAGVSHELKAPLTAIRALAEMLSLGIVPTRAKEEEYFAHIRAESERLSRMIANVLDLSKIERKERGYDLGTGDVGEVVRAAAEVFRPHLASQGFAFEVAVAPDLPPARFDRDALAQVLANLLDNAVKYTAPCETKRIALRARLASPREVAIEVEDSGIGIAPEDERRLFRPFTRGSHPLARGTGGAGLGLAIAKDHVDAHGGRIEVRSAAGRGSTFRVILQAA